MKFIGKDHPNTARTATNHSNRRMEILTMINTITASYLEAIYLCDFQETNPDAEFAPISIFNAQRLTRQFTQLADLFVPDWTTYWQEDQAGYDLYLSSAGHGTGFWDRYTESNRRGHKVGELLDRIAKILGNSESYLGDDGLIYFNL